MTRPTPEQVQAEWGLNCDLLGDLRSYGYVVVHPDDLLDWWENDEAAVDPYALIHHIATAEEQTP